MRLNVLYQFNEKYAPYAGVSMTSLFENNKRIEEIYVYILGEKLSPSSIAKFEELGKNYDRVILFKGTDKLIKKMKEWGIPAYRGSYAANLRLFLPRILDDSIDRVLYLDADTIVNGELSDLCNIDMKKKSLAMALDSLGREHKKNIGLRENDYYFNSGVILFEMNNWKKNELSNKIIEHIRDGNVHYPAPDQDMLNVVCKNDVLLLDARYNMQPVHLAFKVKDYFRVYSDNAYYTKEQIEKSKRNVIIYHAFRFLGEFSWDKKNAHPNNDIFDFYLNKSPWHNYEKTAAERNWMMRIEKILYYILPKNVFLSLFKFMHCGYIEKNQEITYK